MTRQSGRLAMVTGAAGGIGIAIARRLAQEGAEVILADMSDRLEEATGLLRAEGLSVRAQPLDISDEAQVKGLYDALSADGEAVQVLVNNASISPKHDGRSLRLEETPLAEWEQVLRVNLTGTFLMSRGAIDGMRQRGWGRIVNIASLAGRTRSIISGAHYSASKAGVLGMSRMFAGEVAPYGITVNSVAPGTIAAGLGKVIRSDLTDNYVSRIPVGRAGTAEEVAAVVAFISSEETGFITGATFDVNGGYFMP